MGRHQISTPAPERERRTISDAPRLIRSVITNSTNAQPMSAGIPNCSLDSPKRAASRAPIELPPVCRSKNVGSRRRNRQHQHDRDRLAHRPAHRQHRAADDPAAAERQDHRADHAPAGSAQGQGGLLLAGGCLAEHVAHDRCGRSAAGSATPGCRPETGRARRAGLLGRGEDGDEPWRCDVSHSERPKSRAAAGRRIPTRRRSGREWPRAGRAPRSAGRAGVGGTYSVKKRALRSDSGHRDHERDQRDLEGAEERGQGHPRSPRRGSRRWW